MTDTFLLPAGVDARELRTALGHFATGVAVITARDVRGPVGMTVNSFCSVSLDPPLVLFCPSRESRTWPVIERAGRFCVNVLGHEQQDVSTVFGRGGEDKFNGTPWRFSPGGAPLLDGVLTWLDCAIDTVHEAGDHYVVIGRVTELGPPGDGRPLLFYRGSYTVTEHSSAVPLATTATDFDSLFTWPRPDDWV